MIVDEIFCSIVVKPPNKQTVKPAKYSSKPKVYVLLQSLLGRFCPPAFMFHTTEVEIEEGWRLKKYFELSDVFIPGTETNQSRLIQENVIVYSLQP